MKPFYFKEFSIQQTNSALKVGTDAMLLGASVKQEGYESKGLDIGAGTGVLSLMLLQRNPHLQIDAVEIDKGSFEDCKMNAASCPWSNRIECFNGDVFEINLDDTYDLVVCNPPYYEFALKGEDFKINQAKHGGEEFLPKLFAFISHKLASLGSFWCILPFENADSWIEKGENLGLNLKNKIKIYSKENIPTRVVLCFSKQDVKAYQSELIIRNLDGTYTDDYILLTQDFHGVSLK